MNPIIVVVLAARHVAPSDGPLPPWLAVVLFVVLGLSVACLVWAWLVWND